MPQTIDLRSVLGDVRNQGQRGTCLAFAVSAAHQLHVGDGVDLSVETLYWGAKQIDGDQRSGTTFQSADEALRKWGQPAEALWPYDADVEDQDSGYSPPAEAIDPVNCQFAALDAATLDQTTVEALLNNNTVIAIGTPTWRALRHPADGHLTNPSARDIDGGFHAMVIVGHRCDTNEILLRNSWGSSWGHGGHAWIPVAFVIDHVVAAWSITATKGSQAAAARAATATRFGGHQGTS